MLDLMASMENVYSFVDDIQTVPDKIERLDDIIRDVLQQTFECAMFIQEYLGCGFASLSFVFDVLVSMIYVSLVEKALDGIFSDDANDRIEKLTARFVELKGTLDTGLGIQSALVSSRVLKKVDAISSFTLAFVRYIADGYM